MIPKILCSIGIHNWNEWMRTAETFVAFKECKKCGKKINYFKTLK